MPPRILASDTFTWDDNGNMTSKTSGGVATTYTYNYEDQLKELTRGTDTYQYIYNADGLRTKQVKNGAITTYTWDISKKVPELLTDGSNTYLYGLDLVLSTGSGAGPMYYYQDALGSNKILADGNGNVTANYYYKAFGNILSQSGPGTTSLKFEGEQNDDTGLIYLRARYYDPGTGRFTTVDPLPGAAKNAASQNPYVYCLNSPLGLADPAGTAPQYPAGNPASWQDAAITILVLAGVITLPEAMLFLAASPAGQKFVQKAMKPIQGGIKILTPAQKEFQHVLRVQEAASKQGNKLTEEVANALVDQAKALGFDKWHYAQFDRYRYGYHIEIAGYHINVLEP